MRELTRRDWLRLTTAGIAGGSVSGWLGTLAADAADHPQRKRSCILLWMSGGPSQMDTFDLKPEHTTNGGPFKPIDTSVPGIQISEHFSKIAPFMNDMAIIRSMNSKEGDHGRATYLLRTGYIPQGPIQYPTLGALVSKELGEDQSELPNFVSVAPFRVLNQSAFGSGFLGPRYAPLIVGEGGLAPVQQRGNEPASALRVQDLAPTGDISREQADARIDLLRQVQRDFQAGHPDAPVLSHQSAYDRAVRLMRSAAAKAFDLEEEKAAVRDAYGRSLFGQGCLLARRLVERHVPFIEVTLNGWDTHANNAASVRQLSQTVDTAWAALLKDLKERGLLDTTMIVWMGEFGRTPLINRTTGRDHFPLAWSTVLAGAAVKGGQAIGSTGKEGTAVAERPVSVSDFLATVFTAVGVNPNTENQTWEGRPVALVQGGKVIEELVG